MKKFLALISAWTLGISFFSALGTNVTRLEADPSDDLSLTLARAPTVDRFQWMSESNISDIFADHLVNFPKSQVPKLSRHLLSLCRHYRFDPAFVLSLIQVESAFNPKVISPMNAVGLMQVLPGTAQFVVRDTGLPFAGVDEATSTAVRKQRRATERMLTDPFYNLSIGVAYLAWLRDYYQDLDPYYLVAAYNIGPGRLDELRARKSFRPTETKKYYLAIRRRVHEFRSYKRPVVEQRKPARARRIPRDV